MTAEFTSLVSRVCQHGFVGNFMKHLAEVDTIKKYDIYVYDTNEDVTGDDNEAAVEDGAEEYTEDECENHIETTLKTKVKISPKTRMTKLANKYFDFSSCLMILTTNLRLNLG
jgi:hypothetical protein